MKIVHVASEFAPLAKVGGMGDVLLGLARATLKHGFDCEVILPKYRSLSLNHFYPERECKSYFAGSWRKNVLWRGSYESIPIRLIEAKEPPFFEREEIYGCSDDVRRFLYFSRAAFDLLNEESYDLLHLHDWHTSILAQLDERHSSLLTIHNFAYKGECSPKDLKEIGIEISKKCNLLDAGIEMAAHVNTVSPTYAQELLITEPILQKKSAHFSGILNGIDTTYWNPSTLEPNEKKKLRAMWQMPETSGPLVASISRLTPQKGPELIKGALHYTLQKGGQFILLGSAFDPIIQSEFEDLKESLSDDANVHFELTYQEKLAHMVYGAVDLLIIPSLFEPCGLTQMIALHYGTLPLVRKTGGLADTIFEGKNGFTFEEPDNQAIEDALDRAFANFGTPAWDAMVAYGKEQDFSWDRAATGYFELYNTLTSQVPL